MIIVEEYNILFLTRRQEGASLSFSMYSISGQHEADANEIQHREMQNLVN